VQEHDLDPRGSHFIVKEWRFLRANTMGVPGFGIGRRRRIISAELGG
jgi:hypothetical protein